MQSVVNHPPIHEDFLVPHIWSHFTLNEVKVPLNIHLASFCFFS